MKDVCDERRSTAPSTGQCAALPVIPAQERPSNHSPRCGSRDAAPTQKTDWKWTTNMAAPPFSFTPERYWTEDKERALIAFFSSKSNIFSGNLLHKSCRFLNRRVVVNGNNCGQPLLGRDRQKQQWRLATSASSSSRWTARRLHAPRCR